MSEAPRAAAARRTSGAETRSALKEAALRVFRARGYSAAGLEEIGRDLGLTRSTVLFHFGSKAELLREIVSPFEVDIDSVLDVDLGLAPLSPARRRRLIEDIFDCYIRHRDVFRLLAQDITSHEPLGIDGRIAARRLRFYLLMAGSEPSRSDMSVLDAAMGALTVPIFSAHFHPDDDTRQRIVEAAVMVARPLALRSGRAAATELNKPGRKTLKGSPVIWRETHTTHNSPVIT